MMADGMKDSGIEWIGDIPVDWQIIRLKFESYMKGRIGWQGLNFDEFVDYGPYLITGTDFDAGKVVWSRCYHISEDRYKEAPEIHVKNGDLLITKDGTIGKLAYITNLPDEASLNSHLLLLRPQNNKYLNKFLYWMFLSDIFSKYIKYAETGTVMVSLSQEKIGNFVFPIPSISEQQEIVSFLDFECSKIDSIISDIEKQIETLTAYKKSLITETVTKGLDKTVLMKDSGVEWIGKIPEEWHIEKVKHIAKLNGRIGWQGLTSDEYSDEGAYLVTGTDFSNGVINWNSCVHVSIGRWEEAPDIQLEDGDLLITKDGTVGKLALAKNLPSEATLNSGVLLIRTNSLCDKHYLFWVLSSEIFWKWFGYVNAGNSTIIHLYQHVFSNFTFPLPSIKEQILMASFLDSQCSKIDSILADKQKALETMQAYKKSLIYEYVTGKKRLVG